MQDKESICIVSSCVLYFVYGMDTQCFMNLAALYLWVWYTGYKQEICSVELLRMLSKHFKFLTFKFLIKCFIPDSCPEFHRRLSSFVMTPMEQCSVFKWQVCNQILCLCVRQNTLLNSAMMPQGIVPLFSKKWNCLFSKCHTTLSCKNSCRTFQTQGKSVVLLKGLCFVLKKIN